VKLLLLASPKVDDFWLRVLEPLFREPRIEVVGACVDARKPLPLLARLRRNVKKRRGGYVVVMAIQLLSRSLTDRSLPTAEYLYEKGVEFREVHDLYAETTLDFIREREPDCVFRFGFGFIREPVLSLPPKGVISYHHGDIRKYRGQPVAFWELYAGERQMGVTVQVLNEQLDAGKIVLERSIPIRWNDSWGSLERRAYDESVDMIHEACLLLDQPDFSPEVVPDDELGTLYTVPNLRQWAVLQSRVLWRKVRGAVRHNSRRQPM
jgi:methionyl-tRNA formyltransferase